MVQTQTIRQNSGLSRLLPIPADCRPPGLIVAGCQLLLADDIGYSQDLGDGRQPS